MDEPGPDRTGTRPIVSLDGDAPFLLWIGTPGPGAIEAALATLDPARCAVLRIGNPLNAPLSPHRIMLQLASDEAGGAAGADEAGQLLRGVAARAAGRPSLLVVIEQAETLTPAALALLQLLPGLRGPGIPAVRVAFHGTPAFRDLLGDPRFQPIRDHDGALPPPPAAPSPPGRGRRLAVLGAGSAAALLVAGALLLPHAPSPVATGASPAPSSAARPAASPPALGAAATPILAPAPTAPPAAPKDDAPPASLTAPPLPAETPPPPADAEDPAAARARLFREFNAFVEARGLSGRLSRSEREILFGEYLARRQAATASGPAARAASAPTTLPVIAPPLTTVIVPPAQAAPGVVVFFRANRPDAERQADENTAALRSQVSDVTLRPATDGPAEPTVRYFRPEDRSLALTIALALPPATPDWQVVDLSTAAGRPAQPTIEVWFPGPP